MNFLKFFAPPKIPYNAAQTCHSVAGNAIQKIAVNFPGIRRIVPNVHADQSLPLSLQYGQNQAELSERCQ